MTARTTNQMKRLNEALNIEWFGEIDGWDDIPPDAERVSWGEMPHAVRKLNSKRMKKHNPMFNKKVAKKVGSTRKQRFASGELVMSKEHFTEDGLRRIAEAKMGDKNPMRKNPELTATAKAIKVFYEDGRVEEYPYGKYLCGVIGCSYPSVKYWIRHNTGSKKYGIKKIQQLR